MAIWLKDVNIGVLTLQMLCWKAYLLARGPHLTWFVYLANFSVWFMRLPITIYLYTHITVELS